MDSESLVMDAFDQLGIETRLVQNGPDSGFDLIVDPEGVGAKMQVKRYALVTDEVARRLVAAARPAHPTLLVVGDRVVGTARKLLTSKGVGFLDLRGHLALRTGHILIDADLSPMQQPTHPSDALAGGAGLEVAAALLMQPGQPTAVRALSRQIRRAPSTVSEVLARLRNEGLIDASNAVTDERLFWRLAEKWSSPRTLLSRLPSPNDASTATALRFGMARPLHGAGWALADTAAAAMYGAPVAFRSGQALDFFVPDQSVVRRATTLLGGAGSTSEARATLRVPPVPAATARRVDLATNQLDWPLAHPLFVALDLALDVGRGREILEAWTPDERWPRVW
ncbi:hypothetical protein N864_21680 [Intrasporangium chromatireducens Q5-1]|uniref:Transcriptional regulator n=1 Tax=Intrasporangium chromatireducens Q5-1 TaxID=584657 RepID=W9GNI5_9MICO|nr:hypothetical protein [Intrasporangium chromatireducens]EWT06388.1 hypothetical protein N864_21680 [Intrasporangium chromatireducens Q5-1]